MIYDLVNQLVALDGGEPFKFLRDDCKPEVGLPRRQALHGSVTRVLA